MRILKRVLALALCIAAVSTAGCQKAAKTDNNDSTEESRKTVSTADDTVADGTVKYPEFVNPLTGLGTETDVSNKRPVSIMVNNINISLPQEGICGADIMYECLAEGGITRLMMIATEYEKLPQVGSVRSARDYYIDFAESYNCIFVHAGGSDYAYNTMRERGTDHLDGVQGSSALWYQTNTFWRDTERLKNYSSEHTLMVKSGEGLAEGIKHMGIGTDKAAGYETPVNFAEFGKTVTLANGAVHARVKMSSFQTVDYVYSESAGGYLRFQYNGDPHMDAAAGAQLCFENVIVMFSDTGDIPGDDKARIWMQTTGEGSGWYITEGTCQKITWKKAEHSSPIKYYFEDGSEVELNRGKTMINVVPSYNSDSVVFDSDTSLVK